MPSHFPLEFRAAILEKNNAPLVVDRVIFEGPLQPGQVLVRIRYTGICHKQIEEIKGTRGLDPFLPHMLGHEGSGIVMDIGPGVTHVVPGDHVVLHWLKTSGMNAETPIYFRNGQRVNAGWITTFNEYGIISENRMTTVPPDIHLKIACLMGCAVLAGVGVIFNDARVRPGESVLIVGCGGVGLNAIQASALVAASPIIAVDINEESLVLAKMFGATHVLNTQSCDLLSEVHKITDGVGAKYVIIATGSPQAAELAAAASSIPGSVILVGVPPVDSTIRIETFPVHMGRAIIGSYGGGAVPERDIMSYLNLYRHNRFQLDNLISQVVPLEQINQGISLTDSGRIGRCVIEMNQLSKEE